MSDLDAWPCDRCKRVTPHHLLDAVLIDENADAEGTYCRICHPHVCLELRVRDTWRPLYCEEPRR